MSIKDGNIGEWTEPYVLLQLLNEGRIYKSDENLNQIKDVWHDICSIIFKENTNDRDGSLKYVINPDDRTVEVSKNGKILAIVKKAEIGKYATGLRKALQDASKNKSKGGLLMCQRSFLSSLSVSEDNL